jgi:hypothetical protein
MTFMLLGLNLLCGQTAALPFILQRGIRFQRVRIVSTLEVVYTRSETLTAARLAGGRRGYWPVHSLASFKSLGLVLLRGSGTQTIPKTGCI